MGRLAKVMQGQSQPGLKAYKRGGLVAPSVASCECGGKVKKPTTKKFGAAPKK